VGLRRVVLDQRRCCPSVRSMGFRFVLEKVT